MKCIYMFQILSQAIKYPLLFVIIFILHNGIAYAGQSAELEQPSRQAQVFAKVLEETLNSAGLGNWQSTPMGARTPFVSNLHAEYIPTVGVLVHIPVSFPISAPEGGTDASRSAGTPEDLWEKFVGASAGAELVELNVVQTGEANGEAAASAATQSNATRKIIITGAPQQSEVLPSRKHPESAPENSSNAQARPRPVNLSSNPFTSLVSVVYEEERVSKLHDALVDAVAQYGYRLACLQNGERVLILIEAPSAAEISKSSERIGPGGNSEFALTVAMPKERKLLSIPGSAIAAKTTREALLPELTEASY